MASRQAPSANLLSCQPSHTCETSHGGTEHLHLLDDGTSSADEASSSQKRNLWSCLPDLCSGPSTTPGAVGVPQGAVKAPLSAELFFQEFEIGEAIGEGCYGSVWACQDKASGATSACKHVNKWENPEQLMLELECLARAQNHPNILELESVFESEDSLLIVTELCDEGDLYSHILKEGFLNEMETKSLFRQIVGAVHHCHTRGIIHRDIKPENVLLRTCPTTGQMMVKLADFGLATVLGKGEVTIGHAGSRPYEAPEVLNNYPYDHSADVFSLGVLLFSMLSGRWPAFSGPDKEFDHQRVFHGSMWHWISPCVQGLICDMLSSDPLLRPRTDEILCHPWLQQ